MTSSDRKTDEPCGKKDPVGEKTLWEEGPCGRKDYCGMKGPEGRRTMQEEGPCGKKGPGGKRTL